MQSWKDWLLVALTALLLGAFTAHMSGARAQDHHHPVQDAELHEKFYANWMMPDNPNKSCCNKQDCYPTQISYRNGHLYAERREDRMWLRVPPAKVELNRDNPDGRNHLCAPPPGTGHGDTVFCFALGGGT